MDAARREFLTLAGSGALVLAGHSTGYAAEPHEKEGEEGDISAIEDLMREHGVLERVLLIYEEGMRRVSKGEETDPSVFQHTAKLVRKFVEEYHERLEEEYLFPAFVKAGRETELVSVLKRQHQGGRDVTDRILRYSSRDEFQKEASQREVVQLCQAFIRMYRPHAAREDTVLFPALHSIVGVNRIADLGEQFEGQEEKLFGEEGFLKIVDQVANVERQLGIYDLGQFTPILSEVK